MMQHILIVKTLQKEPLRTKFKKKAFDIAKDPKYDRYQRGLASMVLTQKSQEAVQNLYLKMNN